MIVVDILLFCIVCLCVVVFIIVESLDSIEEKHETFHEPHVLCSLKASVDQEKQMLANEDFKWTTFQEAENNGVNECDGKEEEEMLDDWEGIERTELEKAFGEAVNNYDKGIINGDYYQIDGDMKLQLYGLQKVALEGACRGSQPMVLKFSARAKWNAWQKLGDMSRDMAMEKYVNILVKSIPGWKVKDTGDVKDAQTF